MIEMRRIVSAAMAVGLVLGSVETASARPIRKLVVHRHVRVYHRHVYHRHVVAPVVVGSDVDVGLGLIGTGIAGATSATPYPPGYGFYGPGYGFYGPGYGSPGY